MGTALRWTHGRIFTGRRVVEAVTAEDGRVVAAGSERHARRASATGVEVIDLEGHWAVPGLADAHVHLTDLAREVVGVDLHGVRSIPEMGRRVRRWAALHREGPVVGGGWDQDRLRERRYPTARDLARWAGDRPVVLHRVCHHAAVVSGPVLAELGVDAAIRDPEGGRIGRGPDGAPNGLLVDNALAPLLAWHDRAFARHRLGLAELLTEAARTGLTSLGPVSASPAEVEALAAEARRHRLPVRIAAFLRARDRAEFARLRSRVRTDDTTLVGLKVHADGAFGPRTAWLERPYQDAPRESGFPLLPRADLEALALEARSLGARLAVHAIGDRAVATALDVFESIRFDATPRLEHASLLPPALLDRLDRARPHLVVQPRFIESDAWIRERLGARRARWTYPFRTLLRRGHAPAGSSDAPIEPFDPWTGFAAAVAPRPTRAPESVSAVDALRMYGQNAGPPLGLDGIGSLEPGGMADLVECEGASLEAIAATGRSPALRVWREGRRVDGRRGVGGG
jgi:predicted amidohydrolase YtcJ